MYLTLKFSQRSKLMMKCHKPSQEGVYQTQYSNFRIKQLYSKETAELYTIIRTYRSALTLT